MDPQQLLQQSTSLLSSFSVGSIITGIFFSIVGFAAFRYGKKVSSGRHMILGIALMVYGYFTTNVWASFGVGATLTALLFWP